MLLHCIVFSFSKKSSPHPFICLPADVYHSLHINHQSVAPCSPPPGLNLFTFLSFPFLYRESRLIRRSLDLIFIKGSGEGGRGGFGYDNYFFIGLYGTGTKDKWLLVFHTLKKITKKIPLWFWNYKETLLLLNTRTVAECGRIIAWLIVPLGKIEHQIW